MRKRERVALKKLKKSHFEILGGGPRLSVKALRLPLSENEYLTFEYNFMVFHFKQHQYGGNPPLRR